MCYEKEHIFSPCEDIFVKEQFGVPNDLKTRQTNFGTEVFDKIRNKFVVLTPEELIRQSFVSFLINKKNYPKSLLANEVGISIGEKKLRCDTILYDKTMHPTMIIEYKQPKVAITQNTLNQIINYTFILKAKYIVVTNGTITYCGKLNKTTNAYTAINHIPSFSEL